MSSCARIPQRDHAHRGVRFRRFSKTTPIPNAAGTPTNRPPKMQMYRRGDCAPLAPGRMRMAARRANPMKKMPTAVGTGFPVTFMARPILIPSANCRLRGLGSRLRTRLATSSAPSRQYPSDSARPQTRSSRKPHKPAPRQSPVNRPARSLPARALRRYRAHRPAA